MYRWPLWVMQSAALILLATGGIGAPASAQSYDSSTIKAQVEELYRAGKYKEALVLQRAHASQIEKAEIAGSGKPGAQTGEALGTVAWYAVLARSFDEALATADRALALTGELQPARAHALLFLGRTDEARTVYLEHKGKRLSPANDTLWEDAVEEDFETLHKAGVEHAAFGDILATLGVDTALTREVNTLKQRTRQLFVEGKYAEATPLAQRYVALSGERFGQHSVRFAIANGTLGNLYQAQGRYAEAEEIYKRALAVTEKALGPEHEQVGIALHNLATLYDKLGRYAEAERGFRRSLALSEKALGPDASAVSDTLYTLGMLYRAQGRHADAESALKRSLTITEKIHGLEHGYVAQVLSELSELYRAQGRFVEAEAVMKRALAVGENALGRDHPEVGTYLNHLANLYQSQGQYAQAEPLYKRSLAIREKALGADHTAVAESLNNLAEIYRAEGRYSEAESPYRRALDIMEKAVGPGHPNVAAVLSNLAGLYQKQRRYAKAEPAYKRSLAILEKALGQGHPSVALLLNNLGDCIYEQGRYGEAEPFFKRSLAITEKAFGSDHPDVGSILNNLAGLYQKRRQYADANGLYKRSLDILQKALGPDHPDVQTGLNNLASLNLEQGDWAAAAMYWRQSTDLLIRRSRRGNEALNGNLVSRGKSESATERTSLLGLIKVTHRLAQTANGAQKVQPARDMFKTAQWAQASEAAGAVAQMAARQARGAGALSALVRERQDLVGEWQARDKALLAVRSQPSDKRDAASEGGLSTRLLEIDARIQEIDRALAKDFPDYAALTNPEPMAVSEVQALLADREALLVFLDTPEWGPVPEETFIWAITKTGMRWAHSSVGTQALSRAVSALRCGLDQSAWLVEGANSCPTLLQGAYTAEDSAAGKALPFDLSQAHELYQALFGQIGDLIKNKDLLVVGSGSLTALPLQVMVTKAVPSGAGDKPVDHRHVAWLTQAHAITVLPSVSSLKALRQFAKASKARQPFIGFGNPLLHGPNGSDRRAWDRRDCKGPAGATQVASRGIRSAIPKFFRSGLADVEEVRAQYPLPETADELCAVAKSTGAPEGFVYLGDKASETMIKALSADGELAQARVVHFATHGLLAGETQMLAAAKAEPALILTPPATASERDDGLLTASEIAQLRLDADWVVLSACNTAAGESEKPGAEALSGLARAFFYAGARALLASHWAVNSDATVKLITKAFAEIKSNPKIGRAEALRRSMLALIAAGGSNAHPANWAPFVVVGEGAR